MVQNVLTVDDFNRILDDYAGRWIAHVSVTRSLSNEGGQKSFSEEDPIFIKAYFMRSGQNWDFAKTGFVERGDAVALVKIADSVNKDDLIYADGTSIEISNIDGDATTITVDTASAHSLAVGDAVLITNTTNYNGEFTVATVTDTDTFTIASTSHDKDAETSGYVTRDFSKFRVQEAFDVPGVFSSTTAETSMVYTACNLFLNEKPA